MKKKLNYKPYTLADIPKLKEQAAKTRDYTVKAREAFRREDLDEAQNYGMEAHVNLMNLSDAIKDLQKSFVQSVALAPFRDDLEILKITVHKCASVLKLEIFRLIADDQPKAILPLPLETQEMPLRLYKRARIMPDHFQACSGNETYGATAKAICSFLQNPTSYSYPAEIFPELNVDVEEITVTHPMDEVPYPSCSCGFYAYKPENWKKHGSTYSGDVTLEVEFYGKIIQHQMGYRAEYQRVLSCTIDAYIAAEILLEHSIADLSNRLQTEVRIQQNELGRT